MGLLDDAIREHLELKRRRGADAGEISREESEALGPVRRAPTGVPDLSEPSAAEPAAASASTDRPRQEDAHPAAGHDSSPAASAHQPPPASIPQPPPLYPASPPEPPPTTVLRPPGIAPEDASGDSFKAPPAEPEEPARPAPAADESPPSLLSRLHPGRRRHARESESEEPPVPPVAHVAPVFDPLPSATPPPATHEPDIVPAADEPEGEELLEETPEFLEETPEHDRLWFEQRPPRDFDFDG